MISVEAPSRPQGTYRPLPSAVTLRLHQAVHPYPQKQQAKRCSRRQWRRRVKPHSANRTWRFFNGSFWRFPESWGYPQLSSIFRDFHGFSIINHPFFGTPFKEPPGVDSLFTNDSRPQACANLSGAPEPTSSCLQNHRLQKARVCAEHLGFSAHLAANPNEGKLIWYFWLLRRGLPMFIDLGEAKSDINGFWLGPCVLQAEDVHEHLKRSSGCIACIACIQNIQNMGLSFT